MILIFDTETTGLPKREDAPLSDSDNWPRIVEIAWQLHDYTGQLLLHAHYIIRPEGFSIPFESVKIHGITQERAMEEGVPLQEALREFQKAIALCTYYAGHNLSFDINILGAEWYRLGWGSFPVRKILDTKSQSVTDFCKIPGGKNGAYKWPRLEELYEKLFSSSFEKAHRAAFDIAANGRALFELIKLGILSVPECEHILLEKGIHYIMPDLSELRKREELRKKNHPATSFSSPVSSSPPTFSKEHFPFFNSFHNHTQFSVLESTTRIDDLIGKAAELGSDTLAITDNGNMYGCFLFSQAVENFNKKILAQKEKNPADDSLKPIKPVFGSAMNVCENHSDKSRKDDGYKIVLLAKNKKGYENLCKLSTLSYLNGFYYVPRIDKNLLIQHKEGLIALSGWLDGEIPQRILREGEEQAEKALQWYLQTFGEDFYLEIHRHDLPDENAVNEILITFSKKYNIPLIAAHQNYYLNKEDHEFHDLLLCVRDGEKITTPVGKGRGFRYGLPNKNFFFPDKDYIFEHFKDIPEAVLETQKLAQKIEAFSLNREVLLPRFDIPESFLEYCRELDRNAPDFQIRSENLYLRHLTYEGAKKRYGELVPEITERIEFELNTIERMGYPGYFLIVQDFTTKAREMGVLVGPGRGSAAGSVIAYCLGITNVDPLRYGLLFERFLNPDRISMPDIDIDFDDEGREKVLDYVVKKYGSSRVAQIITYNVLGGKSAIRDTARVMNFSQDEINRFARFFPESPEATLHKLLQPGDMDSEYKESVQDKPELWQASIHFRKLAASDTPEGRVIRSAYRLEGSLRATGVHACGVIITPEEMSRYVPLTRPGKEGTMMLTQYDNAVAESAGLLKIDFLGLKTLSILRDTLLCIKERHGLTIDIDAIPMDDPLTYKLFQQGKTNGIFQFESSGMQKYLKELKPDSFSDLIAMNALFRPGPMQYIPHYINRKHGREPVSYDLPEMEDILKDTYGITVYQEQVMLLAQKLAGFSKGDADTLRKAMGKKNKQTLDKMRDKFLNGCQQKNFPRNICEKIWRDWEAFASYAFNKSHSTCYAYLAYQTAYLKAHYPSEFLCAVLNHSKNISDISFFIEECYRLKIKVLRPDINEGERTFKVMEDGSIRFGMEGIKGIGGNVVDEIVEERKKNGPYVSIFDFARRHDTRIINKKTLENLAQAGAFDSLPHIHRAMFFVPEKEGKPTLTEILIKYCGQSIRQQNAQTGSLFAESSGADQFGEPSLPSIPEWPLAEKLKREKELVGLYLSDHPLNPYQWLIQWVCPATISEIKNHYRELAQKEIGLISMVESVENKINQSGNPYLKATIIDKSQDSLDLFLSGKSFAEFGKYFVPGMKLMIYFFIPNIPEGDFFRPVIRKVDFLEEVEHKIRKHLRMKMELKECQQDHFLRLEQILKKHAGENSFEISIHDPQTRKDFNLVSQGKGVKLSNDFFDEINSFPAIQIALV